MPACANPRSSSLLAGEFRIRRPPPSLPIDATVQATPTFFAATQDPSPHRIFPFPHFLPFASLAGPVESLHLDSHGTPLAPFALSRSRLFYFVQLSLHGSARAGLSHFEGIARGALCRRKISGAADPRQLYSRKYRQWRIEIHRYRIS